MGSVSYLIRWFGVQAVCTNNVIYGEHLLAVWEAGISVGLLGREGLPDRPHDKTPNSDSSGLLWAEGSARSCTVCCSGGGAWLSLMDSTEEHTTLTQSL